jgi:hypothetical protein
LRENVQQKRLELWRNHNWLLNNDNAPAHTSLKTNNVVIIPHPPYLPDLAPCDSALFRKWKMKMNGRHFETVSYIQKGSPVVLDSRKMTSAVLLKHGKNYGIAVCIPKEIVLKEVAAKIE